MISTVRLTTLMWLFGSLAVFTPGMAVLQTSEPSRNPILRIETGMHTAAIRRIGVDRAGRYLVTASDDKTARVWELATGRLLRVLRVPVGEGAEGELHGAAISPDGKTIAVGGWADRGGDKNCIYLFDRESGKMSRRLTGMPSRVLHLVFSPDAALLAATLGSTNGVRMWRTADWTEAGRDTAYSDDSYGADLDNTGRLVTSCVDGSVRLYDRSLSLLAKQPAPGGKWPWMVRFSPDGSKVALGYHDTTRVDVLSGQTLALLYSADTSDLNRGNMFSVAWSIDGTMLYAGGMFSDKSGSSPIRRWSDAGRGRYVDTPVSDSTIFDIVPLPGGGIVYGASDPSWGILNAQHKQSQSPQVSQIVDHRTMTGNFLISATGSTVRFAYGNGKSPAVFRLSDRTLTVAPMTQDDLRAPRTVAPGISITDWEDSFKPLLNNTPLKIGQHEISRTFAIAPDGERFLLGTHYALHLFNGSGKEIWSAHSYGDVWGVNISADNRLVVAALSDGTIRWYRMTDGKELLAFFPHTDRKRWIIWTESGYYDASSGGEELIGWHVNNGPGKAADFFPVGQLRSVYYRPDVISKVLASGDEELALKQANEETGRKQQQAAAAQMLPPVVEIISQGDDIEVSSTEFVVRYTLRTPSGEPVTGVRAFVDGRPVGAARGLSVKSQSGLSTVQSGDVHEMRITLPERDSEVSLIASNRFASSVPAAVRVRYVKKNGAAAANNESFEIRPKLYVLAIGVSRYSNPAFTLGFPAKDARDFASTFEGQKGLLYRDVVVKLLTDEAATKDEVLDGLDWIRKQTTSKDVAVILLAGHGVNDQDGQYYFLPFNTDPDKLLRTGVSFSDIKNTVASIAGKALLFIDTCHSGNVMGTRRNVLNDITGVINELASAENGAVVFAASTGNQYSLENKAWGNGAFTKAVVEGLHGRADYVGKGRVTINMLDLYISERVKELTKGQQTPTTAKPRTMPDFPIAVRR